MRAQRSIRRVVSGLLPQVSRGSNTRASAHEVGLLRRRPAGRTIQYGVPFMLLYPDSIVARSASCCDDDGDETEGASIRAPQGRRNGNAADSAIRKVARGGRQPSQRSPCWTQAEDAPFLTPRNQPASPRRRCPPGYSLPVVMDVRVHSRRVRKRLAFSSSTRHRRYKESRDARTRLYVSVHDLVSVEVFKPAEHLCRADVCVRCASTQPSGRSRPRRSTNTRARCPHTHMVLVRVASSARNAIPRTCLV